MQILQKDKLGVIPLLSAMALLLLLSATGGSLAAALSGAMGEATAQLILGLIGGAVILIPALLWMSREDSALFVSLDAEAPVGFFLLLSLFAASLLVFLNHIMALILPVPVSQSIQLAAANPTMTLTLYLSYALIPAICEEVLMRKVVFSRLTGSLGIGRAILLSSLFFALLHGSLYNFIYPFVIGLILAYSVAISGKLWPAILIHVVSNTYTFAVDLMLAANSTSHSRAFIFFLNLVLLLFTLYLLLGKLKNHRSLLQIPQYENSRGLFSLLKESQVSAILLFMIIAFYLIRVLTF